MKTTPGIAPYPAQPGSRSESLGTLFAGVFGLLLGVGLLKFGNPIVLDHLVELPKSFDEWRIFAWPVKVGQGLALLVALVGAAFVFSSPDRSARAPRSLIALLLGWLAWQGAASVASIDPDASRQILAHFTGITACFLLGHWALSRVSEPRVFWLCLVFGFLAVLTIAFDQHFGGLEATRKMILDRPESAKLPPEYLARIRSNRVFGSLVYPNALAGAVLLLSPLTSILTWNWGRRHGLIGARLAAGTTTLASVSVLVWSGSKAGWLIAMAVVLLLLFHSAISRKYQISIAALFVVAGLLGFVTIFREKLAQGPRSAAARMDYWSAAWTGFAERPVLGQGPGAFKKVYARVKRPESEMAQLAHNDYLQQATDSGVPGFLAYSGFVAGALGLLYRRRARTPPADRSPLVTATGLGLLAWFSHGLVEFGLYIPATSWCAFALLGWALAQARPSNT